MKDIYHDENAIHVSKYVLNYIRNRQRIMEVKDLFQNRMALLEEYREWISEGINQTSQELFIYNDEFLTHLI